MTGDGVPYCFVLFILLRDLSGSGDAHDSKYAEYLAKFRRDGLSNLLTPMCPGTDQILRNASGHISSGSSIYSSFVTCRWIVAPPESMSVTLLFSDFDIGPGDVVTVYGCMNVTCSVSYRVLLYC